MWVKSCVGETGVDASDHAGPAAGFNHADDGDEERAEPDQNELQDLIEDGREEAAQEDVSRDGGGGDPDAEIHIPAEDDIHHLRHGEHIDAAHEHGHEAEGDGGKGAGGLAVAQLEIAGDGVGLRDVIERDHHQREKDHGGDGADPIPVRGEDAVLIGRCGPTHEFKRTQIGGEEAETSDPSGHFPAGEEEVFPGLGVVLQIEADADHRDEVERDDDAIDG